MRGLLVLISTFTITLSLAVLSFLPNNSVKVPSILESELVAYSKFFSSAGYQIYGNNLFKDNASKTILDVDETQLTNNSSGIKINGDASFSDAILIYAVNATDINASKNMSSVLVSSDSSNYTVKPLDIFGSNGNYTLGITHLTPKDFGESGELFVSLPLLEDTENISKISQAGWYLILLDSSGDKMSKINFSSKAFRTGGSGFTFKNDNITSLTAPEGRIPNSGFTKSDDINSGKSKSGNFGLGADGGFLFFAVENSSIPQPQISLSKQISQNESIPYDSFSLDFKLPAQLRNSETVLRLVAPSEYVKNTVVIPPGYELSGPLTDSQADDIFEFTNGEMIFNINSGDYQLNSVNDTRFNFLLSEPVVDNIMRLSVEYSYNGKSYILKSNSFKFSHSPIWEDASLIGRLEILSRTKSKIYLTAFSPTYTSAKSSIRWKLPEFIAISGEQINKYQCTLSEDRILECPVSLEKDLNQFEIEILNRRELSQIVWTPIELKLVSSIEDPNYSNNVVDLNFVVFR
jgi:hypothetical protein